MEQHKLEMRKEKERYAAQAAGLRSELDSMKGLLHTYETSNQRKDEVTTCIFICFLQHIMWLVGLTTISISFTYHFFFVFVRFKSDWVSLIRVLAPYLYLFLTCIFCLSCFMHLAIEQ